MIGRGEYPFPLVRMERTKFWPIIPTILLQSANNITPVLRSGGCGYLLLYKRERKERKKEVEEE